MTILDRRKHRPAIRKRYHHGNLRKALIDATLRLVEEGGPERVSVREAAKRAGVSPGAPFRHFPSRTSLLTAVAEEATRRLVQELKRVLAKTKQGDPLARFGALGTGYLRWAAKNPTHFRIVSDRSLVDFDSSESLRRDNEELRSQMVGLLREAQQRGMLRVADLTHLPLFGRALVYGMARMLTDGHMAQWSVQGERFDRSFNIVLDLFVAGLRREQSAKRPQTRRAIARGGAPECS
jgi:AcrR family transcriptional regulator